MTRLIIVIKVSNKMTFHFFKVHSSKKCKNSISALNQQFYPGYRYQIAVRVVDKDGRCSLYSKPVYITPPVPKPEDAK